MATLKHTSGTNSSTTNQPQKMLIEQFLPDFGSTTGLSITRLVTATKILASVRHVLEEKEKVNLQTLITPTTEPKIKLLQQLYVGVFSTHMHKFPKSGWMYLFPLVDGKPGYSSGEVLKILDEHTRYMNTFLGNVEVAERGQYEKYRALEQAIRVYLTRIS